MSGKGSTKQKASRATARGTGKKFPRLGAQVGPYGVTYRVWAPSAQKVAVAVENSAEENARVIRLKRRSDGGFVGRDPVGRAGDRYWLRLDAGESVPDPVSRFQPDGVDGCSMVIDPQTFRWSDAGRKAPRFRDLVIYELHVGTFTEAGTFRGAIEHLAHVRDLGATAIEIMPVGEFPGRRNWGYDGAMLFAPSRNYGTPDDFRALVDAAHGHGLAVILDVVYNHFGPYGNRLRMFAPHFFDATRLTPWGESIHFDGPNSPQVRAFFKQNLESWIREFHLDGFRFDATHAIFDESPKHILAELRESAHAQGAFVIAEDERCEEMLLSQYGFHLDGAWADDFHHTIEVALLGERSIYGTGFHGSPGELAEVLQSGWTKRWPAPERAQLRPEQFIHCISNHDQAGNRPWGDRLNHLVGPDAYRAASALLCLAPGTPLLFMGQEWAASTPFPYFTEHPPELQARVQEGRRRDLSAFRAHAQEIAARGLPAPQDERTVGAARLKWEEIAAPEHAQILACYREALAWRRQAPFAAAVSFFDYFTRALANGLLAVRSAGERPWLIVCGLRLHEVPLRFERDPVTAPPTGMRWKCLWSSNDIRFGGRRILADCRRWAEVQFAAPEVMLLRSEKS